jgi:hypothetical protein
MRRTIFGAHLRNWLRLATLTAWRGLTRRSAAPQRRSKPRLQRAMRSSRFSTRIRSALISPECQFLIPQMRHWISIVERQLDPPPPPKPDANMMPVKIIRAQASPGSKFTHFYSLGETVGVRRVEAEHLIRVGIAEPYTVPPPEEEPGEAA